MWHSASTFYACRRKNLRHHKTKIVSIVTRKIIDFLKLTNLGDYGKIYQANSSNHVAETFHNPLPEIVFTRQTSLSLLGKAWVPYFTGVL